MIVGVLAFLERGILTWGNKQVVIGGGGRFRRRIYTTSDFSFNSFVSEYRGTVWCGEFCWAKIIDYRMLIQHI